MAYNMDSMEELHLSLNEIEKLEGMEAIEALNKYLEAHPEDDEAYVVRGLKYWSLQRRREATNDYLAAIRINPQSRANTLLKYTNSIMDFYNKDLLNP